MRKWIFPLLVFLLQVNFIHGQIKDLEGKVDEYLKPYLETGNFSGALLIAKDGKVILAKGYAMADYEHNVPNTPETVFHLLHAPDLS